MRRAHLIRAHALLIALYALSGCGKEPPPAPKLVQRPPYADLRIASQEINQDRTVFSRPDANIVILALDFGIENAGAAALKDAVIACDYVGKSGTVMRSHTETLFVVFPANRITKVEGINIGFVPQQEWVARCRFVAATRVP